MILAFSHQGLNFLKTTHPFPTIFQEPLYSGTTSFVNFNFSCSSRSSLLILIKTANMSDHRWKRDSLGFISYESKSGKTGFLLDEDLSRKAGEPVFTLDRDTSGYGSSALKEAIREGEKEAKERKKDKGSSWSTYSSRTLGSSANGGKSQKHSNSKSK